MPEHIADDWQAEPLADQHACEAVPQVVDPNILYPGRGPDLAPIPLEAIDVRRVTAASEYVIVAPQCHDVAGSLVLVQPPPQHHHGLGRQWHSVQLSLLRQ